MSEEVIVYSDPLCPQCRQLKSFLAQRGVAFEERDVSADPSAVEEFQRMNAPGVPVTRIGDETIIGFDQVALERALESHATGVGG